MLWDVFCLWERGLCGFRMLFIFGTFVSREILYDCVVCLVISGGGGRYVWESFSVRYCFVVLSVVVSKFLAHLIPWSISVGGYWCSVSYFGTFEANFLCGCIRHHYTDFFPKLHGLFSLVCLGWYELERICCSETVGLQYMLVAVYVGWWVIL